MNLYKKIYKIIIIALIIMMFFPSFLNAVTPPTSSTTTIDGVDKEETIVMIIKRSVSMWYYILRNIAVIIMLILLIFIGIKMATSTIASEKAVYKQMIWDWLVGMIVVFSIHYIMLFIILFNETLVGIISGASSHVVKVERFASTTEEEKSNVELEMSLYDEVKSRAYDPKLTVGTTGTILYMFLVYYAFKFTFLYLKRYMVIIVLTLMSPIVSVSYGFNKVLSGKSKIFSTWLTEYIMNVLIQSLHAFIYASFISIALKLSIINIAGMVLTLILLNFMSKAETLFRRIFKMSEQGSITSNLADSSDPTKIAREKFNTIKNAALGKNIAGTALRSSARLVTKPLRMAGSAAFGGAMLGAGKIQDWKEKNEKRKAEAEKEAEAQRKTQESSDKVEDKRTEQQKEIDRRLEENRKKKAEEKEKKRKEKENKEKQKNNRKKKAEEDDDEPLNFGIDTSFGAMFKRAYTGVVGAFNPNLYTEKVPIKDKDGKVIGFKRRIIRTKRQNKKLVVAGTGDKTDKNWDTYSKKEKKRFFGPKTDSIGMRVMSNFKLDNLLNHTEEEKEAIKRQKELIKSTVKGFTGILTGIPIMIDSPKVGAAILGYGLVHSIDVMHEFSKPNTAVIRSEQQLVQMVNRLNGQMAAKGKLGNMQRALSSGIAKKEMAESMKTIVEEQKNEIVVKRVARKNKKIYEALVGKKPYRINSSISGVNLLVQGDIGTAAMQNQLAFGGLRKRYKRTIGGRVYIKERLQALNRYKEELGNKIEEYEKENNELAGEILRLAVNQEADIRLLESLVDKHGIGMHIANGEIIGFESENETRQLRVQEINDKFMEHILFSEREENNEIVNKIRSEFVKDILFSEALVENPTSQQFRQEIKAKIIENITASVEISEEEKINLIEVIELREEEKLEEKLKEKIVSISIEQVQNIIVNKDDFDIEKVNVVIEEMKSALNNVVKEEVNSTVYEGDGEREKANSKFRDKLENMIMDAVISDEDEKSKLEDKDKDKIIMALFTDTKNIPKDEVIVIGKKEEEVVVRDEKTSKAVEIKTKIIDDAILKIAMQTGYSNIKNLRLNGSAISDIKKQIELELKRMGISIDESVLELLQNLDSEILKRKDILDKGERDVVQEEVVKESMTEVLQEQKKTVEEIKQLNEEEKSSFTKAVQERAEQKLNELAAREVIREEVEQQREEIIKNVAREEGVNLEDAYDLEQKLRELTKGEAAREGVRAEKAKIIQEEKMIKQQVELAVDLRLEKVLQDIMMETSINKQSDIEKVGEKDVKDLYFEKMKNIANKGETIRDNSVTEELIKRKMELIGENTDSRLTGYREEYKELESLLKKPEVSQQEVNEKMDKVGVVETTKSIEQQRETQREDIYKELLNTIKETNGDKSENSDRSKEKTTYASELLKTIMNETCAVPVENVKKKNRKKKMEGTLEITSTGDYMYNKQLAGSRNVTRTGDKVFDPKKVKGLEDMINKLKEKV